MSSLSEIDRDLDQIAVDAARLADVRNGVSARRALVLAEVDAELASITRGARLERSVSIAIDAPPAAVVEDDGPPSGQIDVPDDVLRSSELPAVLALDPEPTAPAEPLSLDLDSGETPFDGAESELEPVMTSASFVPREAAEVAPPTETRSLDAGLDDPSADLASLLGDSDPMRDEGAEPLPVAELEPEATMMFSAEDAARFSRPAPPDEEGLADLELEVDELIELDEEPAEQAEAAPRARTAPPPPPRTGPPPPPRPSEVPPSRGFLGKLLQRKP